MSIELTEAEHNLLHLGTFSDRVEVVETYAARVKAVANDLTRQAVAENERKWLEWSNELALLIPDGDESTYANPEGAQESIILDCFRAYMKERQAVADALAPIRAIHDGLHWCVTADEQPDIFMVDGETGAPWPCPTLAAIAHTEGNQP